ncbi:energy transducer TonB [Microbulbifer elongatus]|uniref:energy transducer TonB n=1 Tax=Microbulbifer elongatus TaxID=86173 RepID=UPI001CFEFAB9|nr:energy transducer TonB [Microbulbifer elongatus]
MVKSLIAAASLVAASQPFSLDWQRPDCSAYDSHSECENALNNAYRRGMQQEFKDKGLSFWYYERPDYSEDEQAEQAFEDKIEGALYFSFTVEKDGSVSDVAVKAKSSDEVMAYAGPIMASINNWQFVPSDQSWPDLEWRYAFYFEPEECEEGAEEDTEEGSCEADSGSDR